MNLNELAVRHQTDKWGHHYYTPHYEKAFQHLKHEPVKLLEIGIGGYEYPDRGGGSLKMWADFFPLGEIYGIDLHDKSGILFPERVKAFRGSQVDDTFLDKVTEATGPLDIIVDDGSHICGHQIASFQILFPHLKEKGIYVIEDTETSYWKDYGGNENAGNGTCIDYFLKIVHDLHHRTTGKRPAFENKIESIQFFNNLIFIQKGYNA